MHLSKKNRTMPWAAAAASLTFGSGACGGDGPPTSEDLARQGQRMIQGYCSKFSECDADYFADYFENVEACEEYYREDYTAAHFEEWTSEAEDPEACAVAIDDNFKCAAGYFRGLSCEEWEDYYTASPESYTDDEACQAERDAVEELCPVPPNRR